MHHPITLILIVLLLCGCSPSETWFVDEPVAEGLDSPDKDVSDYLNTLFQAALTSPKSASFRGQLGMAYDANGFREAALETYRQAESLDPNDFRWPYFMSYLIAESGDHAEALEVLQRALDIDGNYAPAWLWQGAWMIEMGRPEDAMAAYERAIELGAGPAATFGRARVLLATGDYEAAVELLDPMASASEHPFVYRTLGEALRSLGRTEEARRAMVRGRGALTVTWPDSRRDQRNAHVRGFASYELAKSLSASGRVEEAIEILDRLQSHHPESRCGAQQEFFLACNLMNSLAIAYDRIGQRELAIETVKRGLSINESFIPFHFTIANLYREQRDLEGALNHMDRAVELNPARGYAHEQRGRLLFGLRRYEQARRAFEEALGLEPDKRTTLFYLGLAEVELSDWPAAIRNMERVVEIEPDFAPGYLFLAQCLGETGRIDQARAAKDAARRNGADPEAIRRIEIRLRELESESGAS